MLKITENADDGRTLRLRLDGTLNSSSYSELEAVCARHDASQTATIVLDMAGIVFMNDDVARKLAALRSERLRIINCSPFIETLLETVQQ